MHNIEEIVAKILTYCKTRRTTIREAVGKIAPEKVRPIAKALAVNVAKNYILLDKLGEKILSINTEELNEFHKNLLRTVIYEIRYRNIRIRDKLLRKYRISKRDIEILKNIEIDDITRELTSIDRLEIKYSTPKFIINRLLAYTYDIYELENLLRYFQKEPVKYVRVLKRHEVSNIIRRLERKGLKCRVDNHFRDLIIIERSNINLTELEEYKRGIIHPQDKASLAVSVELLRESLKRKTILIDMTAGPGNKISYVAEHGVYSIGLELSRRRILEIHRNIRRLRLDNIDYLQANSRKAPLKIRKEVIILVDPDCTSIGRLHINPEIKLWLTEEDIRERSERQYALLSSILSQVSRHCVVYYCTCTLTYEENERIVIRMCRDYDVDLEDVCVPIVEESRILRRAYLILPHRYRCTGMFIAKLVK
ncbi:MAG: RsmB/NOP family class I SAM-dependent RNA methyltransferase [Crenarchaeota archaeon]|nr:RsmB/NOP family class I SAM-dependent RNA methyltransferase [Thermoproteota archaeon]